MLTGYKKSRYNIYDNLEFLGLTPYELKHFCFGEGEGSDGPGDSGEPGSPNTGPQTGPIGPGGPGEPGEPGGRGDPRDFGYSIEQAVAATVEAEEEASREAAEQASRAQTQELDLTEKQIQDLYTSLLEDPRNFSPTIDTTDYSKKYRRPRLIPKKLMETSALGQDPIYLLPKLENIIDRDVANSLAKNHLDMLKEAGIVAAEENNINLMGEVQKQLDTGLLADYYQNSETMNALEKAGYKTFGTGYRGEFEARTGAENQSVTRDQYDPSTITGSDTSERSSKISLFNQFALENPDMTAMEAMAAFNKIGSFGTISAVDLGMLGYSPNTAIGPQAASNEDQRERGAKQGLGYACKALSGPLGMLGVAEKMAFSGTNTSLFGEVLDGLNNATKGDTGVGIVDEVNSIYDEVANPVSEAFNTAATNFGSFVDDSVNSIFDFFSPEEEATYNPAMGMADPNLAGRSGVSYTGSPFSDLPSDTFENYTNALAGLEEAERAEVLSGIPVDPSMGLADPAFAVQGQLQPGSFLFRYLTPANNSGIAM